MIDIEKCFSIIKDGYLNSDDNQKKKIYDLLKVLSNKILLEDVDGISLDLDKIDPITKLLNRESLFSDIAELKDEAMLMYFHINQITALKELYGFELVEKIIIDKAEELSTVMVGDNVTLYNVSFQKFAVLVTEKQMFEKYLTLLEYSIFNNMEKDIYDCERGYSIVSDFTVGVAYGTKDLFHCANVSLQEAIISKENYKVYEKSNSSEELQRESLDRLKVYKNALHEGNIIPYFQPIVSAKDGSIMKYEALARLHTKDGVISPYKFLNSAIEDKTFEYFTRQMTQKVFNVYSNVNKEISLNLTYQNINSPSMMDYIKNRLDKYGGDRITFEIVETEEIKDYSIVEDFILMVKGYGAKVSIDDFGSGYSNFTNIIKLNIDYIKIDGTLISKLLEDQKVKNMVFGLIQFAKSIDVETIAEFVSSKEICDVVKELGVDYIQGYYYGEPKSAQDYGLI